MAEVVGLHQTRVLHDVDRARLVEEPLDVAGV